MAQISYGRCKNRLRCSLASSGEAVMVPLDGRCPECGQPLVSNVKYRFLKTIPALLLVGGMGYGAYYGYQRYIAPPKGNPGTSISNNGNSAAPMPTANPSTGVVDKPSFDTKRSENAKARADVLERIDRMPNLSAAQKDKLRQSVDKARGMGCVLIIPFAAGSNALGAKEGDLLVKAVESPGIQRLIEDPTLVLVILGYADKRGDAKENLNTSVARAEAVQASLKNRAKVLNVTYAVGMGGSDLFDAQNEARNRKVEVWAVFP